MQLPAGFMNIATDLTFSIVVFMQNYSSWSISSLLLLHSLTYSWMQMVGRTTIEYHFQFQKQNNLVT